MVFGNTVMTEFIWNELALLAESLERLRHNLENCAGRSEYRDHLEGRIDELVTRREHLASALLNTVAGEFIEADLVGFDGDDAVAETADPVAAVIKPAA